MDRIRAACICVCISLQLCVGIDVNHIDTGIRNRVKRGGSMYVLAEDLPLYNSGGVVLTFNGLSVNFDNNPTTEVMDFLNDNLRGMTVFDRLYSAIKLALIEKQIADALGLPFDPIYIETLLDVNNDFVLDLSDVIALEQELLDNPDIFNITSGSFGRRKRKATSDTSLLWPITIPYTLSDLYDNLAGSAQSIKAGMALWEEGTCLHFQEDNSATGSRLMFTPEFTECWSYLGKKSYPQVISINNDCMSPGDVSHIIGHALGFYPEHLRPDRDLYVNINWANIPVGRRHLFLRRSWSEIQSLGIPYDYSSVMHMAQNEFGTGPTITPTSNNMSSTLGQRNGPSFKDIKQANLLYCTASCPQGLRWSACQNEGYRDPNNCAVCKCPDGWSGDDCTTVEPGTSADCGTASLTASSTWQQLTSPLYADFGFPDGTGECSWIIMAPADQNVMIRFSGQFDIPCPSPTGPCASSVELRQAGVAREGSRFCCTSMPRGTFISNGNKAMVLFRTFPGSTGQGFQLEYMAGKCGGCSSTSDTSPSCQQTETYPCTASFHTSCNNRRSQCTRYRKNTCYRDVKKCCSGYTLVGDTCERNDFTDWTTWSTCTESCGGCGTHTRSRKCQKNSCSGPTRQTEACNTEVCFTVQSRRCGYQVQCPSWWGRQNCVRYRVCTRRVGRCCSGKRVNNNRCI